MRADLRHLFRNLRRSPASAVAAVLTLSLTLGAGASIFAVVDAVLLTPPPFADPKALVVVGETPLHDSTVAPRTVSYATFEAWRERAGSLAAMEAVDGTNLTLTGLGVAERLNACDVTPGFLALLGVTPVRGRGFADGDTGRPLAIVSHAFWRGKLAGDPDVIGRQVVLGGQPHTIVGVLPERFYFAFNTADVWRQLVRAGPGSRVGVVARLAENASAAALEGALQEVSRGSSPPAHVVATPVATAIAGDAPRTLGLLGGSAALALLIAFTNLAGLLVVRSIDRQRELAVRTALGARPSEIARQLALEAGTLVAIGILGGVLLASWITPGLGRLALEPVGGVANRELAVSWRVIAFVAIMAAACAALSGVLPALLAARRTIVDVLRRGASPPPRELLLRRVLVTGEVALAFVLLCCLTLLGGSLRRLLAVNPGFDARGVLALQVSLPAASYPNPERVASFYAALQAALEERLGAHAVSTVNEIPLTGDGGRRVVGVRPADPGPEAVVRETGPGYFDVMRIPVVAGRSFDGRDDAAAPARAMLSESLASRLFAAESPIGHRIWLANGQPLEVVGIAGDVKHRALEESPAGTVYLPALQSPSRSSIVVARGARPDTDVIAAVREEVGRLDADLPVYRARSMQDVLAASPGVPARRVLAAAFLGFALLAVVLGAIGLFGVVAHDVAARRTELALRMALGADPVHVLGATLGQAAWMVGSGLVLGGLLSLGAIRALGSLLFATGGRDLLSVGLAAVVLSLAGAAAALPAALRAARTDPLIALRAE